MRITKLVQLEGDVEIEVYPADVIKAIQASEDYDHDVFLAVETFGAFMHAIPDSYIAKMSGQHRRVICEFLTAQAKRFAMPGGPNES